MTKRQRVDAYQEVYKNVTFTPIASTGRPGTPHRFFVDSFRVQFANSSIQQIVHKHSNGLTIITAGDMLPDKIDSIHLSVEASPVALESTGSKRKKQSKMLKGKLVDGVIQPTDVIGTINGKIPLYSCVWGSVLETNVNLTTDLLQNDPLLDGYLIVVLPTGPFPPNKKELE